MFLEIYIGARAYAFNATEYTAIRLAEHEDAPNRGALYIYSDHPNRVTVEIPLDDTKDSAGAESVFKVVTCAMYDSSHMSLDALLAHLRSMIVQHSIIAPSIKITGRANATGVVVRI